MNQLLMPFDERAAYRQAEDHKGLRIVLRWMTRYTEGGAK